MNCEIEKKNKEMFAAWSTVENKRTFNWRDTYV